MALSFLGIGLFLYGIGWLLLPHPDGRIHAEEITRGKVTAGFVGSVIAITSGMSSVWGGPEGQWLGWGPGPLPLIAFGVVVWWLMRRRPHPPADRPSPGVGPGRPATSGTVTSGTVPGQPAQPAQPAPGSAYEPPSSHTGVYGAEEPSRSTWARTAPSTWSGPPGSAGVPAGPQDGPRSARAETRPYRPLTMITIGAALLAGVLTHLLTNTWATTGAAALGVVGLGLLASGLAGRRGGLLIPVGFLLAFLALGPPSADPTAAGQATWAPATATLAEQGYQLGAGEAVLDLTSPGLLAGATAADPVTVPIQMGVGELTVILPRGTRAQVEANLGIGEIIDQVTDDQPRSGLGLHAKIETGTGDPVLRVSVSQGIGETTIRYAQEPSGPSPSSPSPSGPASSGIPSTSPGASS